MQTAILSASPIIQRRSCEPGSYPRQASNSASMAPTLLGSLIVDSKGDIRFISDSLAHLADMPASELAGRPVRTIMPDLPLAAATEGYNVAFGAFSAAQRQRQAWIFKAFDNTELTVEGRLAMLKLNTGYLFSLELHRVQVADNTSGDAECDVRLAFDRQFRIGFASSSIECVLGFDYEGIVGTHVSALLPELLHRFGGNRSMQRFKKFLRTTGSLESHARHRDGRQIPVVVTLVEDPSDGILPLQLQLPCQ